jgi:hypothetical protein
MSTRQASRALDRFSPNSGRDLRRHFLRRSQGSRRPLMYKCGGSRPTCRESCCDGVDVLRNAHNHPVRNRSSSEDPCGDTDCAAPACEATRGGLRTPGSTLETRSENARSSDGFYWGNSGADHRRRRGRARVGHSRCRANIRPVGRVAERANVGHGVGHGAHQSA